jgi:predicted deacetylase
MRYVILRDDDTNALTPVECLERLYRPFLDRGLPVNLATIPCVTTDAKMPDGRAEGFLPALNGEAGKSVPLAENPRLVRYLLDNPGYHILQHGYHHSCFEFDRQSRPEIGTLLDQGTQRLLEAGFRRPRTFVAPYDRLSRQSMLEVRRRFEVLSTGWYELRRLPVSWWPRYAWKKMRHTSHWRMGRTLLLSHPGCLLSYQRSHSEMLEAILHHLSTQHLTVLVTHWWEYFRGGQPDEPFIDFLHQTGEYLANNPELKVIAFSDLVENGISLN